jgi:thiol:disulfide interchange protein
MSETAGLIEMSRWDRFLRHTLLACACATVTAAVSGSVHNVIADQSKPEANAGAGDATAARSVAVDWQPDFDQALVEAKEQKKFVLVDVYTDWCVYCKKLDREVYPDPAVSKYLAEKFVCVRANAEDNAQGESFSNKFDAHAYPTLLFFDSQSKKTKPLARISGYLPPREFDAAIHSIVESKKMKKLKHKK